MTEKFFSLFHQNTQFRWNYDCSLFSIIVFALISRQENWITTKNVSFQILICYNWFCQQKIRLTKHKKRPPKKKWSKGKRNQKKKVCVKTNFTWTSDANCFAWGNFSCGAFKIFLSFFSSIFFLSNAVKVNLFFFCWLAKTLMKRGVKRKKGEKFNVAILMCRLLKTIKSMYSTKTNTQISGPGTQKK